MNKEKDKKITEFYRFFVFDAHMRAHKRHKIWIFAKQ